MTIVAATIFLNKLPVYSFMWLEIPGQGSDNACFAKH